MDNTDLTTEAVRLDTRNYIENNMARFVHILRHLGVRISSAETVEAMNALTAVDILDRRQVETALLATLAKSPEDRLIVDRAFNAFFITPEQKRDRAEQTRQAKEQEALDLQAAEEELTYMIEDPEDEEGSRQVNLPLTEEEKKTYLKLPEDKKNKIKDYLNRQFQSNPVNNPEEMIANLVKSSLNYWKHYLKMQDDGPPEVEYTGDEDIDEILQEVVEKLRDDEHILYQDIQKITETDMPTAALLIKKLSKRLATRISRRYHRSRKKQTLDLRRTIRQNIRYGGTLLNLKYRSKKVQKPKILLICDVSGSMAKYAGFVLQFMYGLSSVTENIESFIFSEDVERVTSEFTKDKSFEANMAEIINRSESWGRGTNLDKALDVITGEYKHLLNSETFVIIVSDTKTLNVGNAYKRLKEMKKRVKDIVWLNTLPKKVWADTPSVAVFQRGSRMFECNTLAHLDKIMRTQMLKQ